MPSDVLITPATSKIDFTDGANSTKKLSISGTAFSFDTNLNVLSSTSLSSAFKAQGVNGTLFEVIDDLSNSLMSVNTIGGFPVFEVFANNSIIAGQYNANDFVILGNKIGLGYANPVNKLTVSGSVSIGSSYNVAAPSNGLIVQGNVGIGTVSPTNGTLQVYNASGNTLSLQKAAGGAALAMGSETTVYALIESVNSGGIKFYTGNGSQTERWTITAAGILQSNGAQTIQTSINNLTLATLSGNGHVLLSPHGTGNVGIGTVTPRGKLEISNTGGSRLIVYETGPSTATLELSSNTYGTYGGTMQYDYNAETLTIQNYGGTATNSVVGSIVFKTKINNTTATNVMLINGFTGNVGIATLTPSEKLEVVGVIKGTSFSGAGTGLTGVASNLTAGTVTTNANLTGPITSSGNGTAITDSAVTYAKIQNVNPDRVLGRTAGSAVGIVQELTGSNIATIIGSNAITNAVTANTANALNTANSYEAVSLNLTGTLQFGGNINWNHGVTTELGRKTIGFNIWQGGKKLYADEDFSYGNNNISVYNNAGGTALTITRTALATAPNSSGFVLRVAYTPGSNGTSPGFGGFFFGNGTSANKVFAARFIANIPTGRTVNFNSNAIGTNANYYWLTNNVGTGKWEEYSFIVMTGNTGTFGGTNYFSISGGADVAFTWDIASATVFDVTNKRDVVSGNFESYQSSNALTFNYLATNLNNVSPVPIYGFDVTNNVGETRSIKAGLGYERHLGNGRGTLHIYNRTTDDTTNITGLRATPGDIKVSIDNVGNVGIGITIPNSKLHVFNSAGSSTIAANAIAVFEQNSNAGIQVCVPDSNEAGLFFSRSGAAYYSAITRSGTDLLLKNNSSTSMTINSNGNVGVGIADPTAKLDVTGSLTSGYSLLLRSGDNYNQSDSVQIAFGFANQTNYRHSIRTRHNPLAPISGIVGNNIDFYVWKRGTDAAADLGSQFVMTMQGDGAVGIGITNPVATLHLNSTTSGATLLRADGTNGTLFSVVDDLSDSLMSVNNSAGLPVLEVFADDRVVAGQYGANDFVLRNNKLGLGTNNPAYRLNVYDISSGSVDEVFVGTIGSDQVVGGRTGGSFGISTKSTSNGNLILTANSAMYLRTGGSNDRVFIKSDGNVGIGIVTPNAKLEVNGVIRGDAGANYPHSFTNTDAGNTHWTNRGERLLTSNGTNWRGDGADPIMALVTSGNGNATTIANSIGLAFHNESQTDNTFSPALVFSNRSNSGSYNTAYAAIIGRKTGQGGPDANWSAGELHFYTMPVGAYVQNVPSMLINSAGKVGMGTLTPVAKLHIGSDVEPNIGNQTLFVQGSKTGYAGFVGLPMGGLMIYDDTASTAGSGGAISFGANAGSSQRTWIAAIESRRDSAVNDGTNYGGSLVFYTRPAQATPEERMRINSSGNVGVGRVDPAYKLDVGTSIVSRSNISTPRFSSAGGYVYGITNSPVWNQSCGSYVNNNTTAPDGTTSAGTYTLTSVCGSWDLYQTISSLTVGRVYTIGMWVKLGTATNFCVTVNNTQAWNVLGGKAFTSSDGLSTGKWTHVSYTFTAIAPGSINIHLGYHAETAVTQQTAGTVFLWNIEMTEFSSTWIGNVEDEIRLPGSSIWTSRGNVGIGTISPAGKLTVQGNIEVNYNSILADSSVRRSFLTAHATINRGANISFGLLDGASSPAGMTVYNTAAAVGAFNSQFIAFSTHEGGVNEGERMRITSLGNVGIGTISPATLLQIGTGTPTSATGGIQFGDDTNARIYRINASTIQVSNNLTVGGTITGNVTGNVSGTAGGETFATVTGRGSGTTTQISVGTTSAGSMFTGEKIGSGYSDNLSGATFKSITNHPTGASFAFAAYYGGLLGTNSFYVSAEGGAYFKSDVGIGTVTPAAKLDIAGTNTTIALSFGTTVPNNPLFISTYGSATGIGMDQYTAGLRFAGDYSGGSNPLVDIGYYSSATVSHANWISRLRVQNGGNVGIGIASPVAKLNVLSTSSLSSVFKTEGVNGTLFEVTDDLSNSLMSVNTIGGLPVLEVFANNSIIAGQYGQNDFVISGNKVGIGTASPIYKLDVYGSSSSDVGRFYNNSASCNFYIGSTNNTAATALVFYTSNGNGQIFKNRSSTGWGGADSFNIYSSNGAIAFHPAGTTNALYIANNGNVGINATTSIYKLDVNGTARFSGDVRLDSGVLLNYNGYKTASIYIKGVGGNFTLTGSARAVVVNGNALAVGSSRGLVLTILKKIDFSHISSTTYDTYGSTVDSDALAVVLNNMTSAHIGILTSSDAFDASFTANLRTVTRKLGLSKLSQNGGSFRRPYAAIFMTSNSTEAASSGVLGTSGVTLGARYCIEDFEFTSGNSSQAVIHVMAMTDGTGQGAGFSGNQVTTALYGTGDTTDPVVLVNGVNVGIGTLSPATLLQIGTGSPTSVTEGIQFGDDTSARLYRTAPGVITCPGTIAATFSGGLTGNVTGNVSGSSGTCSGLAASATTAGSLTSMAITQFTGTLAVANGGTGGNTSALGRTGLGATTLGANLFTLANVAAERYIRINANNTVDTLTSADFKDALGIGAGSGTVTGVTASTPLAATAGNAPVISLNNNGVTFAKMQQVTGPVAIGRTAASLGDMATLSGADLASIIGANTITNATNATLATKASTLSQSGGTGAAMTFNWSGVGGQPTWLWGSNDGTNIYVWNPSNFNVNSATSATTAGALTSMAITQFTGTLAVANGGTGATSFTAGQILFGNGTGAIQSSAGLAWNNSTGNLGIGTSPSGFKLDVNGTIHYTSLSASSDGRFKKNVQPIPNALDRLSYIRGVKFEWNEFINDRRNGYELNKPTFGVIAQELEEVFPELITLWKLSDDCADARSVNYEKIIPILIEAVKELNNKNKLLESRLLILENK